MFYKKGEVISDQFEHLKMFSFRENGENGRRGRGEEVGKRKNFILQFKA